MIRIDFSQSNEYKLPHFEDESIKITGVVSDEVDERENTVHYFVKTETINGENLKENLLVIAELYPEFKYGDRVLIEGIIKLPESFETESGRIFDYASYLSKDRIYSMMIYPEIELIDSGNGFFLKRWLFSLKTSFLEKIKSIIPEPESSLAGGLIVGAKESLGEELLEDFRKTGLIHIVVLSGYNVTIIADALTKSLQFIAPTAAPVLGILSIFLFAIMVGAGATIVRASIMASLAVFARFTGRESQALRLLFIAGFIMVLHNPLILTSDLSFQLSFLATFGLITVSPILERYFLWVPEKYGFREIILATFSTQIFVLPLLMYSIGEISLIAPVTNILVLIFIPITMFLGFLTGTIFFISKTLALPFGFLSDLFLSYEIWVVETFSKVPFASVFVPEISLGVLILIYVIYLIIIYRLRDE